MASADFLLHGTIICMIKKEKFLIIGNWKANPDSLRLAKSILTGIKKASLKSKNVETVICPPVIYLESLKSLAKPVLLGSQDFFYEPNGAFTGMVGYESLVDTKIRFALVGHSEIRSRGETDETINKKVKAVLSNSITPILCVGETERSSNMNYLSVIRNQLQENLKDIPKSKIANIIVAYEPVWAIGAGASRSATPEEINEIVIFIKRVIGDMYKTNAVPPVRIIYGASVDPLNAGRIIKEGGVDGLLVGRASLTPKVFSAIVSAVNNINHD